MIFHSGQFIFIFAAAVQFIFSLSRRSLASWDRSVSARDVGDERIDLSTDQIVQRRPRADELHAIHGRSAASLAGSSSDSGTSEDRRSARHELAARSPDAERPVQNWLRVEASNVIELGSSIGGAH
ncbi:hypothetical protein [Variovorax saccharolyticus]|uniref:hypothetical protein n=1 Tax=Variovorax saccharolyticus TaxID=3053516 RepID=UPI002579095B|nr:hypothetical protein [Variovorax sp. J22R187]MDM0021891.1 hypothetical protein [Variovorax sp. J22R187]